MIRKEHSSGAKVAFGSISQHQRLKSQTCCPVNPVLSGEPRYLRTKYTLVIFTVTPLTYDKILLNSVGMHDTHKTATLFNKLMNFSTQQTAKGLSNRINKEGFNSVFLIALQILSAIPVFNCGMLISISILFVKR